MTIRMLFDISSRPGRSAWSAKHVTQGEGIVDEFAGDLAIALYRKPDQRRAAGLQEMSGASTLNG